MYLPSRTPSVLDNKAQHAAHTAPLRTESVPVTVGEEAYTLDIQVETIRVAGVSDRDIIGVWHSVTLPIAPEYFLNAYNMVSTARRRLANLAISWNCSRTVLLFLLLQPAAALYPTNTDNGLVSYGVHGRPEYPWFFDP
jgi:hypothetical protein